MPRAVTVQTALGQKSHQTVTQNCQSDPTRRTLTAPKVAAAAAAGGWAGPLGQQGVAGVEQTPQEKGH